MPYNFADVDAAYDSFNQLAHAVTARNPPAPISKTLPHLLVTANLTSLQAAYDSLVDNFIAPLGPNIPPHIRVEKRKVAQTVAAEMCLSLLKLPPRFRAGGSHADLRFPPDGPASATAPGRPTALPRASLLHPAPPLESHAAAQPAAMRAAAPRSVLGRHVRFTRPLPRAFLALNPDPGAERVPHWTLGADPAAYDYAAAERAEEAAREMARLPEEERRERARRERASQRAAERESQRFEEMSQAERGLVALGSMGREEAGVGMRRGGTGSLLKSALEKGKALRESQRSQRESQIGSPVESQVAGMSSPTKIGGTLAMRPTLPQSLGLDSSQSLSHSGSRIRD